MMPSRRPDAHRPRPFLTILAGVAVLFLFVLPVVAEDVALPLPDVAIPPIQGKTGSFDIMEIDQAAHLMYVGDRVSNGVDIFDVSTPAARYLQTVSAGSGVNGVLIAKGVNKLFATTNDSRILIIDLSRRTVIADLNTGGKGRTDEMGYDPNVKKVYAVNDKDRFVTVVDAVRNTIIKKIDNLPDGMELPIYNPVDGMMYLSVSDDNLVLQFDTVKDVLVQKWPVGVPCEPHGMAINPKTNQALLGCGNAKPPMTVLWDVKAGKVTTTFNQLGGGDMAIYSAKANLFFFAAHKFPPGAVIGIFTGSPVRWVGNIPTARGSHSVAYDETNHVIYTGNQQERMGGLMSFWLPAIPR